MRHTPLSELRHRDFLSACRRVIAESTSPLTAAQVAEKAAKSPAPWFYVSYQHALRRIRFLERHGFNDVSTSETRKLYDELYRRVRRLMQSRGISDADALAAVLAAGNAPEFYFTPGSAAYLYSIVRRREAAARAEPRTRYRGRRRGR